MKLIMFIMILWCQLFMVFKGWNCSAVFFFSFLSKYKQVSNCPGNYFLVIQLYFLCMLVQDFYLNNFFFKYFWKLSHAFLIKKTKKQNLYGDYSKLHTLVSIIWGFYQRFTKARHGCGQRWPIPQYSAMMQVLTQQWVEWHDPYLLYQSVIL